MKNTTLSINSDYINREHIFGWLSRYCRRNNISILFNDTCIELTFKSQNQRDCFVRNGNLEFPFFEFL